LRGSPRCATGPHRKRRFAAARVRGARALTDGVEDSLRIAAETIGHDGEQADARVENAREVGLLLCQPRLQISDFGRFTSAPVESTNVANDRGHGPPHQPPVSNRLDYWRPTSAVETQSPPTRLQTDD